MFILKLREKQMLFIKDKQYAKKMLMLALPVAM